MTRPAPSALPTAPAPPVDPAAVGRIVVRSTNWLGDVVMIAPALRALRAGFPAARVEVLARASVAEAFRGHPLADDVVSEERRSGSGIHDGARGALRLAATLRRRRYDMAVILPKSAAAALAPALAGIPIRVGYPTQGRGALLTHRVPVPAEAEAMHHAELFLGPARYLGCPTGDRRLAFPLSAEDRAEADRFLATRGAAGESGPLVAIHPGASRPERAWGAERFGAVGRGLRQDGARLLVLGAPADREAVRAVLSAVAGGALDATGVGGIRVMAALVERCALFVGNDSGPMHIAAAVGTPTVAVFGPGVPWKTAPFVPEGRRREVTLYFPCAPCRQEFFRECEPAPSGKPWCLESLPVDRALAAARDLLRAHAAGKTGRDNRG